MSPIDVDPGMSPVTTTTPDWGGDVIDLIIVEIVGT